jgi:hypothetical protein
MASRPVYSQLAPMSPRLETCLNLGLHFLVAMALGTAKIAKPKEKTKIMNALVFIPASFPSKGIEMQNLLFSSR